MYKITNVSLEEVLRKYNVTSLSALNDDQLQDVCSELKIIPKWKNDPKNPMEVIGIDVMETINSINKTTEVSTYMPRVYWNTDHRTTAERMDFDSKLQKHTDGSETFEAMQDLKFGVYRLRSGESKELDVSKRWVTEELLQSPIALRLKVETPEGEAWTAVQVSLFDKRKGGKILTSEIVACLWEDREKTAKVTYMEDRNQAAQSNEYSGNSMMPEPTSVTPTVNPEALSRVDLVRHAAGLGIKGAATMQSIELVQLIRENQDKVRA